MDLLELMVSSNVVQHQAVWFVVRYQLIRYPTVNSQTSELFDRPYLAGHVVLPEGLAVVVWPRFGGTLLGVSSGLLLESYRRVVNDALHNYNILASEDWKNFCADAQAPDLCAFRSRYPTLPTRLLDSIIRLVNDINRFVIGIRRFITCIDRLVN